MAGGLSNRTRWSDFSEGQRTAILVGTAIEVVLTTVALADLARRPRAQVRVRRCACAGARPQASMGSGLRRSARRAYRVPGVWSSLVLTSECAPGWRGLDDQVAGLLHAFASSHIQVPQDIRLVGYDIDMGRGARM